MRDRRHRDATGLAVVEGPRAVDGALASGAVLEAIYARDELVDRYAPTSAFDDHPDSARLGPDYRARIGAVHSVAANRLNAVADTKNPQGVLAVARFADTPLAAAVGTSRVVVLEAVRNPGNAGAMVRSATAAGFGAVIATQGTTDLWSPKALRGAAGLTFGPMISRGHATSEVLDALADADHLRVRAAPDGDTLPEDLPHSDRMTLVVGNEAHGPSTDAVAGTDVAVAIPMAHPVDSLNVAVAAAVLMYMMRPVV